MPMLNRERVQAQAIALGFDRVGVARATPSPTLGAYLRWIDEGMHADMGYLARPDRVQRRENLQTILPHAQTLIIVARDYRTQDIPKDLLNDPSRGRIASYAWGVDYHEVLTPRLKTLAEHIQRDTPHDHAVYVDTGAILERSHAQQAGMGFIGKNTMLIHPKRGSLFFIGELLSTLEADEYDTPHRETLCGTCTRCLNACPTGAFVRPHVLDARLCISYHTIENKGQIPQELRAQFGNWVYGCDVCQDVCPFNRFALPSQEKAFYAPDVTRVAPLLADVLQTDEDEFKARYGVSPIYRIKRERWVRNGCIAAGNSGDKTLIPHLERLLKDPSPLIQTSASWALERV